MSLAIFNINDAGVQLTLDGDLVRTSPGYAVLNNNELLVGEQASEQSKLLPRWTNTRYWSQLDTNPLSNGTSQIRHHADIAFAHLEDLWKSVEKQSSENLFIVPGYFNNDQLSLLLGLANECNLPVSGIVDQSIVAASNLPLHGTVLHLDIHLHAITLTRVQNTGALVRRQVIVPVEAGLFTLWDRWANIIADQFIQTTRFDPMHTAAAEQQLFNQLPGWVANLGDANSHPFTLDVGGSSHTVTVSRDALMQACTSIYPQIVQAIRSEMDSGQTSLLLSHRFAGFPGLHESLALVNGIDVVPLSPLKASGSAFTHSSDIMGEPGGINFVVQLNAGEVETQTSTALQATLPTHLLWRHQAFPIGAGLKLNADQSSGPITSSDPIATVYHRNQQTTLEINGAATVTVNHESVNGSQIINVGDIINIDGEDLSVIAVRDHG